MYVATFTHCLVTQLYLVGVKIIFWRDDCIYRNHKIFRNQTGCAFSVCMLSNRIMKKMCIPFVKCVMFSAVQCFPAVNCFNIIQCYQCVKEILCLSFLILLFN